MLTTDELIEEISATIGKIKVIKLTVLLKKQNFSLRDLIDITFHADKNIAFRATWILENVFLGNPESYINDMQYLFRQMAAIENPSCKRHYAKIVMHITDPKAPLSIREKVKEINLEPIVEQLFDWIIDPPARVAIKVFSCRALFNIKDRYPWIAEELKNQIQFLMRDGSAGIQSRGKKLLAQISLNNIS